MLMDDEAKKGTKRQGAEEPTEDIPDAKKHRVTPDQGVKRKHGEETEKWQLQPKRQRADEDVDEVLPDVPDAPELGEPLPPPEPEMPSTLFDIQEAEQLPAHVHNPGMEDDAEDIGAPPPPPPPPPQPPARPIARPLPIDEPPQPIPAPPAAATTATAAAEPDEQPVVNLSDMRRDLTGDVDRRSAKIFAWMLRLQSALNAHPNEWNAVVSSSPSDVWFNPESEHKAQQALKSKLDPESRRLVLLRMLRVYEQMHSYQLDFKAKGNDRGITGHGAETSPDDPKLPGDPDMDGNAITPDNVVFVKSDVVDPIPLFPEEIRDAQNEPSPYDPSRPVTQVDVDRMKTSEEADALRNSLKQKQVDSTTRDVEEIIASNLAGSGLSNPAVDTAEPTVMDNENLAFEMLVTNRGRKTRHIDPILDPNARGMRTKQAQFTGFRRPKPMVSISGSSYSTEPNRTTRMLVSVENGRNPNKWERSRAGLVQPLRIAASERQHERPNVANTSLAGATINDMDSAVFESTTNPGKTNTTVEGTVDSTTGEVTSTAIDDEMKDLAVGTAATLEANTYYENKQNQPIPMQSSISPDGNRDEALDTPALNEIDTAAESKVAANDQDMRATAFLKRLQVVPNETNVSIVKNFFNGDKIEELKQRQTVDAAAEREQAANLILTHAQQEGYDVDNALKRFNAGVRGPAMPVNRSNLATSNVASFGNIRKIAGSGAWVAAPHPGPHRRGGGRARRL